MTTFFDELYFSILLAKALIALVVNGVILRNARLVARKAGLR